MRFSTRLLVLLCCMSLCSAFPHSAPNSAASCGNLRARVVPAAVEPVSTPLWGARGPEHCALSIGIFLGGALGFWVNPFLGTQAMRLGLMASVLNCS